MEFGGLIWGVPCSWWLGTEPQVGLVTTEGYQTPSKLCHHWIATIRLSVYLGERRVHYLKTMSEHAWEDAIWLKLVILSVLTVYIGQAARARGSVRTSYDNVKPVLVECFQLHLYWVIIQHVLVTDNNGEFHITSWVIKSNPGTKKKSPELLAK